MNDLYECEYCDASIVLENEVDAVWPQCITCFFACLPSDIEIDIEAAQEAEAYPIAAQYECQI